MAKDFSLKELKKIAKEEIKMEEMKEIDIAKNIIKEYEDRIVDDINEVIIEGLKFNKDVIEINPCKLSCLKDKKNLSSNVRNFIACYFLRLYKEKGFPVDMKFLSMDTFCIFSSKFARWSRKVSLFW